MQDMLQVAVMTILLFVAQEALRHAGKWLLWSLFLLVPLVLTPYWVRVNEFGPFLWIKTYSVFFCVGWGALLRFTSLGRRPWARFGIPVLLAVNIFEATILDLLERGLPHQLNAAAGLMLIVTLPYGVKATRVDSASRCRDLLFGTTRGWVCGYTVWNWTFVCLNYPSLTGHHTAVLLCGLIVAAIDPRRWTQTRACVLGINLLAMATCNTTMTSWLDPPNWSNEVLAIVAAGTALTIVVGCSIHALRPLKIAGDSIR